MSACWNRLSACSLASLLLVGCGQSTPTAAPETPSSAARVAGAPADDGTASSSTPDVMESDAPAELTGTADAEPAEGTPAWMIQEIMRIRLLPLPSVDAVASSTEGEEGVNPASAQSTASSDAIKQQIAQTREIRRERNQQIVTLAMNALAQTAKDPAQEPVFLAAVHHLLDAQLQLALQGDEQSIAALYDAAEAFYAKMPESPAAAEAQLTLVNLAHANALRYAKSEPRWLQELSRHAQLYATRFPGETSQSLPLLLAAGRSCELNGLIDEAKSCFSLISTKFSDSPQASQVAGIVRRLNLQGQKLEFAGPTLDGNFLSIGDFTGKTVIVVFWATHARPFLDVAPELQALTQKYQKYAQVLSVNLDSEEGQIDAFLEKTSLPWPVIFHAEHNKRGWNAPLAAYYGVTNLPTIWIVDPTGVVAETDVTSSTLEAKLRDVILRHRNAAAAPTVDKNAGESPSKL